MPMPKHLQGKARTWKKGQSGNPNGQPKGTISQMLETIGDAISATAHFEITSLNKNGKPETKTLSMTIDCKNPKKTEQSIKWLIAFNIIKDSLSDSSLGLKLIDRLEGKPKETVDFTDKTADVENMTDEELLATKKKLSGKRNE